MLDGALDDVGRLASALRRETELLASLEFAQQRVVDASARLACLALRARQGRLRSNGRWRGKQFANGRMRLRGSGCDGEQGRRENREFDHPDVSIPGHPEKRHVLREA